MEENKIGVIVGYSTIEVDKKCPKCNINMFIYTGNTSNICYVCKICGHRDYNIEYVDWSCDKRTDYKYYDRYIVLKEEKCKECDGHDVVKKHKFDSHKCHICKGKGYTSKKVDLREALQDILNNKQIKLYVGEGDV